MVKPTQLLAMFWRFAKGLLVSQERPAFRAFHGLFADKIGLEIGGPSSVFRSRGILPVYPWAARVDGINFATTTLWEGEIREGMTYRYAGRRVGRQYVGEASHLGQIADGTYDFVLSSHSLEHSANPVKCLAEWIRVLRPGGAMLLILPDARFTFDHRRPVTSFEHLLDDYRSDKGEDDLTHLDEILALHDLARDPGALGAESFRARSLRNFENRALHQHVFDAALVEQLLHHFGIRPLYTDAAPPFHIISLATTAGSGIAPSSSPGKSR
jgi:SAM-dependent methyltransferase